MFLDEIGEMTLRMQGLLLRFLETGELQKVGADRVVGRVDVRVIAATNRNLRDMIGQGTFREDLFYRLNVIHLLVPPLRERREDIPALADHFLDHFTRRRRRTWSREHLAGRDATRWRSTRGRATFASWRTSSSGWPSPAAAETIQLDDLPLGDPGAPARVSIAPSASVAERWPTISTSG